MALQTEIYNLKGKTEEKITLPDNLFQVEDNSQILAQAIRVYLSNLRKAKAHAKTRSEVIGSTKKIYRQKGTGGARHGDIKAPIFVGGGKAHGPTGEQNYHLAMPKKMRRLALAVILSNKLRGKSVFICDGLSELKGKTKQAADFLKNIIPEYENKKILVVLSQDLPIVKRTFKNIPNASLITFKNLSADKAYFNLVLLFDKEIFVKSEPKKTKKINKK